MNRASWWFDARNSKQVLFLLLILIIGNFATWLIFLSSQNVETFSSRKPIVILDVIPSKSSIKLGERYGVTFAFEKTRSDCEGGHITRHMVEAGEGWTYKIQDEHVIVSEPGYGKISVYLPTVPLDDKETHLVRPGLWSIKSTVSYQCPIGDGEFITRDTSFSTPIFEVLGQEQGGN